MKTVGNYAFEAPVASCPSGTWERALGEVESWVGSKGTINGTNGDRQVLTLNDGRIGTLRAAKIQPTRGEKWDWSLEEPTDFGSFLTKLSLARDTDTIAVQCELSAGFKDTVLAPVSFEARCPKIIPRLLGLGGLWAVGGTQLSNSFLEFETMVDGDALTTLIQDDRRTLPMVVISQIQGNLLHPQVADQMARDLTGVAVVAVASAAASWRVTSLMGVKWSCFNGAIRLYWPFSAMGGDPSRHPYWTHQRLLEGTNSPLEASWRIREQLRRRLLSLSTMAMHRSPLFNDIFKSYFTDRMKEGREAAANKDELINFLEQLNTELGEENRDLNAQIERQAIDLENAQVQLEYVGRGNQDQVAPEAEEAPTSVSEAVNRARRRFGKFLIFGDDVADGIASLNEIAGPPEKVLQYLEGLADLAVAMRSGPLGQTVVAWLRARNFNVSTESETSETNSKEQKRRTWHDGKERRYFDIHMKPNDATSPDRCVRIYFDTDQTRNMVIIAWVGRKPGL